MNLAEALPPIDARVIDAGLIVVALAGLIAVAASVAAIVMALIGGLTAIILKLLDRDRTKTDRQLDKTAKDVVGAQIDFATVRERVSVMWDERGKCEALELEAAFASEIARATATFSECAKHWAVISVPAPPAPHPHCRCTIDPRIMRR